MSLATTSPVVSPAPRALGAAGAATLAAGLLLPLQAAAASKEVGVWYDDTGKGAVEIFSCGRKLCGRIFWLKDPLNKDGTPLYDGYNPRSDLRSRPICGLQVLGDLERQPDGTWDAGWVYDPKVGKSYDAAISLSGSNTLVLTGYKGVKFLSKSFTWTRAPRNLPKCSSSKASSR
ncbi:MAG: DUF2147 domain-containing protein [Hyphomicrobiaceae bacterium]